jgi:hypothetical protein
MAGGRCRRTRNGSGARERLIESTSSRFMDDPVYRELLIAPQSCTPSPDPFIFLCCQRGRRAEADGERGAGGGEQRPHLVLSNPRAIVSAAIQWCLKGRI